MACTFAGPTFSYNVQKPYNDSLSLLIPNKLSKLPLELCSSSTTSLVSVVTPCKDGLVVAEVRGFPSQQTKDNIAQSFFGQDHAKKVGYIIDV